MPLDIGPITPSRPALHRPGAPAPGSATAVIELPKGHDRDAGCGTRAICTALVELQRNRVAYIRLQNKIDNSTRAFLRSKLGFRIDLSEAARERIRKDAERLKKEVEKWQAQVVPLIEQRRQGLVPPTTVIPEYAGFTAGLCGDALEDCVEMVIAALQSRRLFSERRDKYEARMRELAKQLPVYETFIKPVAGVTEMVLAIIIGECGGAAQGDLGRYPTPSHLHKRLGLAVIGDRRQGNPGSGASEAEWLKHGYNRRRRAETWAFLDDVMFRSQWRGALKEGGKVIGEGYAIGRYGEHYARKKADYLGREWTPAHADKAARRYMAKMFIRDLWLAWRETAVQP